MAVDLEAALGAADRLAVYERDVLGALVARRSVRGEPSGIHELCADLLDGLGMRVELVEPQLHARCSS